MHLLPWMAFAGALLILGFAVPLFVYGVFLLNGEENAPFVGGWVLALAIAMTITAALLLWVWKRRLFDRRDLMQ